MADVKQPVVKESKKVKTPATATKEEKKATPKKRRFKWTRRILKGLCALIILLIAGLVGIYFYLGAIVKYAIETYLPPITETTVKVDNIDLSIHNGHIAIEGFMIGNVKGFTADHLFKFNHIIVDFDVKSVFTDKIIISNISIDGTGVAAEINNKGEVNLLEVANTAQKNLGINPATGKEEPKKVEKKAEATSSSNEKSVVIKRLSVTNTALTLGALGKVVEIELFDVVRTGIGEVKKETWKEALIDVFATVVPEKVQAQIEKIANLIKSGMTNATELLGNMAGHIGKHASAIMQGGTEAFNQSFDAAKQAGSAVTDHVKNAGSAVTDSMKNAGSAVTDSVKGLGGLFGK